MAHQPAAETSFPGGHGDLPLRLQASILAQISDAVIAIDCDRRVTYMNAAAEQRYEVPATEAIGRPLPELHSWRWNSPEDEAASEAELLERGHWRGENVHVTRSGREIAVESTVTVLRDEHGNAAGLLATVRDIGERKRAEAQTRRSQRTFSELVERAPFGIFIVDSRFRISLMNSGSETGAFRNVRPVVGRDFSEVMRILWPEPVAAEVVAAFRHTLDTGDPYHASRFVNPRRDIDAIESYEWELHRIALPDGQSGVVCYYFDSTRLLQAEAARRESEELLKFALAASSVGAWDLDLEDHTASRSLEHDRIFGYEQLLPEWTFEMFLEHVLPEDRAAVAAKVGEAMAAPSEFTFECRIRRRDGEVRWIWVAGRHRLDAEGASDRMGGIVQDITERRKAMAALQASEERYRMATQAANVAIWELNLETGKLSWGDTYARLFGPPAGSDPSHQWWVERLHPQDRDRVLSGFDETLRGTATGWSCEYRFLKGDGTWANVRDRASITRDENGKALRLVGAMLDTTELTATRQQLKVLTGLLPICAVCKKIRDKSGDWHSVETYIRDHSEANFSHGMCPGCAADWYRQSGLRPED